MRYYVLFNPMAGNGHGKEAAEKVVNCKRNCAFIVTERHDMVRKPWKPIIWILKNKRRVKKGLDICWD